MSFNNSIRSNTPNSLNPFATLSQISSSSSHALGSREIQELRQDPEQTEPGLKRAREEILDPTSQKRIRSSEPISTKFELQIAQRFENPKGIQEIHLNWTKPYSKDELPVPPKNEEHPFIAKLPDPKDVETSTLIDCNTDIYDSEKRLILGYRTGIDFGNADFFRPLLNLPHLNMLRGPASGKVPEKLQNPEQPCLKTKSKRSRHYSTKFGGFASKAPKTEERKKLEQQARTLLAPLCQKVGQVMEQNWPTIHAIHQKHIEDFNKQANSPSQDPSWFKNHFSQIPGACYSAAVCNLHQLTSAGKVYKNSQAAYHFDDPETDDIKLYEGLLYFSENIEGGDLHLNELGITIRSTNHCFLLFKGTLFSHGVTNIKQKEPWLNTYRFSCSFMGVPTLTTPVERSILQFNQPMPKKRFLEGISSVELLHNLKKGSRLTCLNEESPLKTYPPLLFSQRVFSIVFTFDSQEKEVTESDLLQRVNVITHQYNESITQIFQEYSCNIKDFIDQRSLKTTISRKGTAVNAVIDAKTNRTSTKRELFSLYVGNHRLLDRALIMSPETKMPDSYEAICQYIQNSYKGSRFLLVAQKQPGGYLTLNEFGKSPKETELETEMSEYISPVQHYNFLQEPTDELFERILAEEPGFINDQTDDPYFDPTLSKKIDLFSDQTNDLNFDPILSEKTDFFNDQRDDLYFDTIFSEKIDLFSDQTDDLDIEDYLTRHEL